MNWFGLCGARVRVSLSSWINELSESICGIRECRKHLDKMSNTLEKDKVTYHMFIVRYVAVSRPATITLSRMILLPNKILLPIQMTLEYLRYLRTIWIAIHIQFAFMGDNYHFAFLCFLCVLCLRRNYGYCQYNGMCINNAIIWTK